MILLERIARARRARAKAHEKFVAAMREAKNVHSWAEIAEAAGLSKHGVRYLVNDENAARKEGREL